LLVHLRTVVGDPTGWQLSGPGDGDVGRHVAGLGRIRRCAAAIDAIDDIPPGGGRGAGPLRMRSSMKSSGGTRPRPAVPKMTGGPMPAATKRLARQRRPGWIVVGAMLVAFAVLANVHLFRSAGERMPVVRLARDV